jgi:hypothetical protein
MRSVTRREGEGKRSVHARNRKPMTRQVLLLCDNATDYQRSVRVALVSHVTVVRIEAWREPAATCISAPLFSEKYAHFRRNCREGR